MFCENFINLALSNIKYESRIPKSIEKKQISHRHQDESWGTIVFASDYQRDDDYN